MATDPAAGDLAPPWARWGGYLSGGLGAQAALRPWAVALHTCWLAVVALAFLLPAWALVREAVVFYDHGRAAIAYLGQLDYGESPLLAQAVQWLHGQQIYHDDAVPPFVVGNYTPVFTWAVAAVIALWTGVRMGAGRIVSVAADFGTALSIAGCVFVAAGLPALWPRRGQAPAGALRTPVGLRLIVAVFAGAAYLSARYVWAWGVYGRVDNLAVCLSLAGLWCVLAFGYRQPRGRTDPLVFAAILFVLAVYTRQDTIEGAVAGVLGLALYDWRRALRLIAQAMAMGLALGAVLMVISHGQFYTHVVVYNQNHFSWGTVRGAWSGWLRTAGGAVLVRMAIVGAIVWLACGGQVFAGLLLLSSLLSSMTIGKIGSSINYFLPLVAACCLCSGLLGIRAAAWACNGPVVLKWAGLAVAALFAAWATGHVPGYARPLRALSPSYAHFLVRAASGSQTMAHTLTTRGWASTPRSQPDAQWHALIARVAATDGPVISEDMSFVVLAGKPLAFQPFELTQASQDGSWNAAPFLQAIAHHRYPLIILPVNLFDPTQAGDLSRWTKSMYAAIRVAYQPAGRLEGQWLYTPTPAAAGP